MSLVSLIELRITVVGKLRHLVPLTEAATDSRAARRRSSESGHGCELARERMGGVSDSGGVKLCERTRQECGAGAVAAAVESSREAQQARK